MSDFTSGIFSGLIAFVTLAGIFACMLLLWMAGRKRVPANADNTTGHVWDEDLKEANNPLPLWWVGLFVITTIFGVVYLVLYPGLGSNEGQLAWTSGKELAAEIDQANQSLAPIYAKYTAMPIEQVARDRQAMAIGERLFMNNCSQCHGSDARGGKGFPNLTDNDWLHGGSPDKIVETITKGRIGIMPPIAAAVGSADDISNVSHYVLSLSGSPADPLKAQLGRSKFGVCAACHGRDGTGNPLVGAPNLSDKIWLHGFGVPAITAMINNGKRNEMPAQEGRLTEPQIYVLGAYVWGLSNEPAAGR